MDHVRFLGMILDNRMNWRRHVQHVVEKCKRTLNLMRCVSGQHWGADKTSLMLIYRALIRSRIDYGSIAYNTASDGVKAELDRIQSAALKICCGSMKGTAIAALQVECGEMPLKLRRENQSIKYALKIQSIKDHPANEILRENFLRIKEHQKSFIKSIQPEFT